MERKLALEKAVRVLSGIAWSEGKFEPEKCHLRLELIGRAATVDIL